MKRVRQGLNRKEQKVVSQFVRVGRPAPMTIAELADACWAYLPPAKANSWVRNSIRRPVALGILAPVESGVKSGSYQVTPLGRELIKSLGLLDKVKKASKAKKVEAAAPVAAPAPVVESAPVAAPVESAPVAAPAPVAAESAPVAA